MDFVEIWSQDLKSQARLYHLLQSSSYWWRVVLQLSPIGSYHHPNEKSLKSVESYKPVESGLVKFMGVEARSEKMKY